VRKQRGGVIIGLLVGLAAIYLLVFTFSARGWGYPGYASSGAADTRYGGFSGGFFYWGGPSIYRGPSVRDGSVSGPGYRGGGVGGGK
jgi:hypothetical protein